MKTSVLIDHEPVADGGFLVRLLLRIEGEQPEDRERIPLNLSLVLDRSGSMAGPKLAAARDAAAMLVQRLWLEDVVSVVAYDDQVEVIAVPASGKDRENTSELIGGIRCGGTTNLSGGWLRGRDLIADGLVEGGVNRVLMLTDGHANVGITDPNTLVGLCRAGQEAGITTTTIGFGIEFDEQLLSDMADAGGGATYYIEEIEQAAGVFEEELEGLLSLSAQNVRVTVEPGADADFLQVLHQYPSHAEGEKLTLEVGDLYAREPRLVLAEFLIPPEATEGEDGASKEADLARITVQAHVLTKEGGVELRTIELPLTLTPEKGGHVEPEVRREVLFLAAARARTEALEARERGDSLAGAEKLRAVRDRIIDAGFDDARLDEEVSDLHSMSALMATEQVSEADSKYMRQRSYDSYRSRKEASQRIRRSGGER